MKNSEELRRELLAIHRKSYPAYKSLKGNYDFGTYQLSIDHVQGDPFASPSKLSVHISRQEAGFPAHLYQKRHTRIALQDYLTRRFRAQTERFCFQAKGSGKSGMIAVSSCGQEILERTACEIRPDGILARFDVGFPANGRTIQALELEKILFDFLPQSVERTFFYRRLPASEVEQVFFLAEDQQAIREELSRQGLVAFIANGAILPRESGVSDRPMKGATPFQSPKSLEVTLHLPHAGEISGMGIRRGITLIAGGGYHGKSTVLQALERGVYNHISGDGREYVITEDSALKLRAEDGRKISGVDISLFINQLPNGRDTRSFSTLDASGSTSQAANIMEGVEAGSRLLLIDEDTSATNFMVRDELMQKVITRDKEPITPFLERARDLYERAGISTILVVGSCGSYFFIADTILQMDNYRPVDITEMARQMAANYPAPQIKAPGFQLPEKKRHFHPGLSTQKRKNYRGTGMVTERLKMKILGKDSFLLGNDTVDLRYVEQLVDREQTAALGCILQHIKETSEGGDREFDVVVQEIMGKIEKNGLAAICDLSYIPFGLAMPRIQEIYACLNRY
ncbi:ABC-ATPase domain-containing protein [Hominifimenecus sp. rT4P-3]|uniref:ABC-ATPase domain-containing protein n=1 Tax=Hominifimenecus sp. rT4P-3 TaxID=3242979 RepID=UPI003DA5EA18